MPLHLVTGGCGFIDSHLSAALIARGDRLRVLDDLSNGLEKNLAPFAGVELVRGDIRDADLVERSMKGVTTVLHLAALGSVARSVVSISSPRSSAHRQKAYSAAKSERRRSGTSAESTLKFSLWLVASLWQ